MRETLQEIEAEARQAEAKYGAPTSSHESLGVLYEEFQELTQAIRGNYIEDVRREAIQVAAVALRLAEHCRIDIAQQMGQTEFSARSGF